MTYGNVQWGWHWLYYAIFSIVVMALMISLDDDDTGAWIYVLTGVFLLVLFVVLVWFSRLEVSVDDGEVTVAFGWTGRPHRSFALDDIVGVEQVRNKWWYGFGVRRVPSGCWMYNIWGLDAVELRFTDDTAFRIGTDDPGGLLAALTLR